MPIYSHIERIANLLRTETRRAGLEKKLQPVHIEALYYLSQCNVYSNTPAAVTEYLGLTKGTVSQTLNVLEAAGLIEKRPDPKDRRVVKLQITEAGQRVISDLSPPKALSKALETLSESDQAALLAQLDVLLRALLTSNQYKTFGACHTCYYHQVKQDDNRWCRLTGEHLQLSDIQKICREHQTDMRADVDIAQR